MCIHNILIKYYVYNVYMYIVYNDVHDGASHIVVEGHTHRMIHSLIIKKNSLK